MCISKAFATYTKDAIHEDYQNGFKSKSTKTKTTKKQHRKKEEKKKAKRKNEGKKKERLKDLECPPAAVTAAVNGRIAVPAFPRNSWISSSEFSPTGNCPPQPSTIARWFSLSSSTLSPSVFNAPSM